MKICTKCSVKKPLSEFHNCASKPGGKFSACKECRNNFNKAKAAEIGHDVLYRRALQKDPESYRKKQRDYYEKNREAAIARTAAWRAKDPEATKEFRRAEYVKRKPKALAAISKWQSRNPEKVKAYKAKHKADFDKDPANKPVILARKMLKRILAATGERKTSKTFDMLGYTREEFMAYIEKQFQEGMSWDNHGKWHLDHIVSVTELVRLGVKNQKTINALSNLRPLWAKDNLSKHVAFDLSIQVCL